MGNWGVAVKLYKTNADFSVKTSFGGTNDYFAIAEYWGDGYNIAGLDMSVFSEAMRTLVNQRLMIRFYWCPDVDGTPVLWYHQCSWATEVLTAVLDAVEWEIYYDLRQVGVLRPDYFLDYNCPADNTRIENFSYTPTVVRKKLFGDGLVTIVS